MTDPIFLKIQRERQRREQQRIQQRRNMEKQIREHEYDHLKAAGKYAKTVKWIKQKDKNNIEHIVNGVVPLDLNLQKDVQSSIQKYETLLKSAQAPEQMSSQDKRVASWLEQRLNNLRRYKNK